MGLPQIWLHVGCTSQVASTPIENAPDLTGRRRSLYLEHETGLEPATPTLATCSDPWILLPFPAKPPPGAALGTRA